MDLYLIRHGETIDNVAGLYAGIRDSALTVHGVEQARRLGTHLANSGAPITHIFSSPLTRAYKTAQSIQTAQKARENCHVSQESTISVGITEIADLIEQDFGSYEGKPYHSRSRTNKSAKDAHRDQHKNQPGFVDVESRESMAKRADAFLDNHLLPIFECNPLHEKHVVAVVSHGILLANLWRRLLTRLPPRNTTSLEETFRGLEHLGGWSNTGYLHLSFSRADRSIGVAKNLKPPPTNATEQAAHKLSLADSKSSTDKPRSKARSLEGWLLTIISIDSKVHLAGLKRQRGGIGRLAHDEGQTKLDTFFKRQKTV